MKKIFYSLMALTLLSACSNEDMMPDATKEGPVQLASVSVGRHTRGVIIDDNFVFGSGDQVLMTAMVDEAIVRNTFTYDGNTWTQDAPTGRYSTICWQDNPTIRTIVSYGGKPVPPATGMFLDQNSEEKYIAADRMEADPGRPIGSISITDDFVSAELGHASADFVVKVRDGNSSANVLDENIPVLTVTIDADGLDMGSATYDYIAWNTGKSQDEYGDWHTTFRVILPEGCTILKATLSRANATAGDATTEMRFFWAESSEPSDREELKHGTRYSATYEYNEYLSVTSAGISIMPFDEYAEQDITASKDWSFDETTKTYTVFTASGLQIVNQDIANNIATKGIYNITLAADIILPDPANGDGNNWIPLGYSGDGDYTYEGTFDGAGHTISNLQVNRTDMVYPALVGYAGEGCKIENLTLARPTIIGGNYAGGIIAFTWDKNVSITNCHIIGGSIKGGTVGGVAGEYEGNIVACTVNGTTLEGYTVGGIIGGQYIGRIIACGVDGVNFILSYSNAPLGGIAGYVSVGYDNTYTHIYGCYVNDCTKGTDSQAIEGNANLIGEISVLESNTATMYNCAYRTKGSSITYGVCGTEIGPTDNNYTVDMFITQTGMTSTDWSIAASNLNEGIRDWNEYNPTLPCNWEWDATEEGKLKVKQ